MRRKGILALLSTAALICCLTGCQGDVGAEPIDTEKTIQESQQSVTVTEQTSEYTEISETFSEQSEGEVRETIKPRYDTSKFIYPDDPLTAENLLTVTTAAKVKLIELGETSNNMILYRFGLLDIDFDGFPEMLCEFFHGHNHTCRLYSLKEENFCEMLLEYEIYYKYWGKTTYYLRKSDEGNSVLVYSDRYSSSRDVYTLLSEISNSNAGFEIKEKFFSCWKYISKLDAEYQYEPAIFSVDGDEVDWEKYEKEYMTYMYYADVEPMEYVYEGIDYNCHISDTYQITEKYYGNLYSSYYFYLSNIKNKEN